MSYSINDALNHLDLSISDFIGLSEDEIKSKLTQNLPADTDVEELSEQLQERLEEIGAELEAIESGLKDDYDAAKNEGNSSAYYAIEYDLQKIEALLSALNEFEDALDDWVYDEMAHQEFLVQEADYDLSFTYDSSDLDEIRDGDSVKLTYTGSDSSSSALFEIDDSDEETQDLYEDGFITLQDELAKLEEEKYEDNVFIEINDGDDIELISFSENPNVTVFQVTTEDGKTFTIEVSGAANIVFSNSNGLDNSEIQNWPDALNKITYLMSDPKSFYAHNLEDNLSTEERLSYIENYDDVMAAIENGTTQIGRLANLSQMNTSSFSGKSRGLTDDLKTAATDALNSLYEYIDNVDADKDSIESVWDDILDDLSQYSKEDQAKILQAMMLAVAQNTTEAYFQAFFAPAIVGIQNILLDCEPFTATHQALILLLEKHSGGAGNYGGDYLVLNDLENNDTFTEQGISLYQSYLQNIDWATEDHDVGEALETLSEENASATQSDSEIEDIDLEDILESGFTGYEEVFNYLTINYAKYATNVKDVEFETFLQRLKDNFFKRDPMDMEGFLTSLKHALDPGFGRHETEDRDDLINSFVKMLQAMTKSSNSTLQSFANQVLSDSEINAHMISVLRENNGMAWKEADGAYGGIKSDEEDSYAFLLTYSSEGLSVYDEFKNFMLSIVADYNEDVTKNEMEAFIELLIQKLENGKSFKEALQSALSENAAKNQNWEKEDIDDLATNFTYMLAEALASGSEAVQDFAQNFLSTECKTVLINKIQLKGGSIKATKSHEEDAIEFLSS